jgi:GntR family transcriptional regulator
VLVVNLNLSDGRPIYLQIVDEIRRALAVGSLQAEDAMPSVRELASQLVVNPRTVLQAYQELEREGVLYVRRGQGTFVSSRAYADRDKLVRAVARRSLLEARRHGVDAEELIEAIRNIVTYEEPHPVPPEPAVTKARKR